MTSLAAPRTGRPYPPGDIPDNHLLEAKSTPDPTVRPEGLKDNFKNVNDPIGNRTRGLPRSASTDSATGYPSITRTFCYFCLTSSSLWVVLSNSSNDRQQQTNSFFFIDIWEWNSIKIWKTWLFMRSAAVWLFGQLNIYIYIVTLKVNVKLSLSRTWKRIGGVSV